MLKKLKKRQKSNSHKSVVSGSRALLKLAVVEVEGGAGHLETGIWALGFGP